MYEYRAKVVRVVDGDTVDFLVDLGFKISFKIRTRLVGVNTPERGKTDFNKATVMLENLMLSKADEDGYNIIKTNKDKTGKYGRWLVTMDNINSVLAEKWPY
jgi:micrococcal nuclease